MARVTRVARKNFASTVDAGAISRAAQTGQTIASAVGAVAQQQERLEQASAKSEVAKANAAATRTFQATFDNNRIAFQKNPVGGAKDFESNIDTETSAIRDTLTSDLSKRMFDESVVSIKSQYQGKRDKWQVQQVSSNVFSNISEASDSYANQAFVAGGVGDFDNLQTVLTNYNDIVVASGEALSPENMKRLNESGTKAIVDSFLLGAIKEQPEDAITLLESGRLDDLLSPEERVSFGNKAFKESERQEKVSIEEDELLQSQNYFEQMVAIETGLNTPSVDDIVAAVTSGDIDESDGERLIKSLTKDITKATNVDVYSELNIKLSDGSITQRDISDAVADGEITTSQATRFIDLLTTKVASNPAYKRALLDLEVVYPKGGFLGRTAEDERLFIDGVANLQDAITEGRNPIDVIKEIRESTMQNRQNSNVNAIALQVANAIGDNPTPEKIDEEILKAADGLQRSQDDSTRSLFRAKIKELNEQRKRLGY